jgi:hypothetical protein
MTLSHATVEAYVGYTGEEAPRAVAVDDIRLSVDEILVAGTPRHIAAFPFTR